MLGENVHKIRIERNLSRRNVSKLTDISERTIEFIEKGKILNPRIDTVEKIAIALDVSIDELIK